MEKKWRGYQHYWNASRAPWLAQNDKAVTVSTAACRPTMKNVLACRDAILFGEDQLALASGLQTVVGAVVFDEN